jgi:hypothetical protein
MVPKNLPVLLRLMLVLSVAISAYGANKSAKTSEANAREQRAWQTEMSNTAHTREIAGSSSYSAYKGVPLIMPRLIILVLLMLL